MHRAGGVRSVEGRTAFSGLAHEWPFVCQVVADLRRCLDVDGKRSCVTI